MIGKTLIIRQMNQNNECNDYSMSKFSYNNGLMAPSQRINRVNSVLNH